MFESLTPNSNPPEVNTSNPTENLTLYPRNRKAFIETTTEKEIVKKDLT